MNHDIKNPNFNRLKNYMLFFIISWAKPENFVYWKKTEM